jgi:F0F1-type ATP synthase membrane subunit b/b'
MRFATFSLLLAACTDAATPPADATLDARDAVLASDALDASDASDALDALALDAHDDAALGLLDGGAR